MTIIANPIYDTVFKFLMEDNRVAKILLSALLQKEVVEVRMRQTEYTDSNRSPISMFRLDFAAKVREKDGTERLIMIELQKTWLETETLRFRQYLGTQYLDESNIPEGEDNEDGHALPMVSIYILGHKLGDLQEPVVYVRQRYLDQDSNPIVRGVPDPFIESLTHDTIVVQIPYLKGRVRNHLERLLNLFDQDYRVKTDRHLLEVDEEKLVGEDEWWVMYRLVKAASMPDTRKAMRVEDEILSVVEKRDTTIMVQEEEIKQNKKTIELKDQELEQKELQLKQNKKELAEKDQKLEQQDQVLRSMMPVLRAAGWTAEKIAEHLHLPEREVRKALGEGE